MSGRAATDRVIRGRAAISVNDPGHALPVGWTRARLTDVADLGTGHTPSRHKPEYWDGEVGWIGIRDAGAHHGGTINTTARTITPLGVENSAARLLPQDTICLSRTASVGYVVKMGRPMTTSQDFVTWSCSDALDPDYLMRALLAEGDGIRRFGEGSTHTTIYFPAVKAFTLDLPPRGEQRRIVAKLDALTARLARARAELARVPVLAASWRRHALAEAFAITNQQTTSAQLCVSITDGDHQAPPKAVAGIPFITISAMNDGHIDLGRATRFVPESYFAGLKDTRRPRTGDILYSVTGSFGISAVVQTDAPFVFQRHIAILRPDAECCDPEWLAYMLAAPQVRAQAEAVATGTAQMTVPLTGLRAFILPCLPLREQREQALSLKAAFARADRVEAEATRARALINRLEAAVLARAFRGKLVPQDPADEPASILLDRIRAQRDTRPLKGRNSRKL